jgi:hypothetical protein
MKTQELDLGFLILSPDKRPRELKNSCGSVRNHSFGRQAICIVGKDATAPEVKALKEHCEVYKGKDTITSLVNTGMSKIKNEWAFIIFSGSRIRLYLEQRLSRFVTSPDEILYPVVERKINFVDSPFDGILINKKTFKKVGNFPDAKMEKEDFNDFEASKLLWANDAVEAGCVFKGIVGMKVI